MLIIGAEILQQLIAGGGGFSAKMVFNQNGAIIFPPQHQHREMKAEGISYEDDYKGNALAAMLMPGRIEVRFHGAYADADVARMLARLLGTPELAVITGWTATYQGRPLSTR
jgi:hypothetical protein